MREKEKFEGTNSLELRVSELEKKLQEIKFKMEFRKVKLPQDTKGCAVCGEHPTITELIDYEQAECDGVHL